MPLALALACGAAGAAEHEIASPDGRIREAPELVVELLKALPPAWDDVRFLDGYPGRDAVLAPRSGETSASWVRRSTA